MDEVEGGVRARVTGVGDGALAGVVAQSGAQNAVQSAVSGNQMFTSVGVSSSDTVEEQNALGVSKMLAGRPTAFDPNDHNDLVTRQRDARRRSVRILIDPGHGENSGNESGGTDGHMRRYGGPREHVLERDLALEFGFATRDALEAAGFTAIMTREGRNHVRNAERSNIGMRNNIDAFISIHFNGGSGREQGFETFYSALRPQDIPFASMLHENIFNAIDVAVNRYYIRPSGNNAGQMPKPDTETHLGTIGVLRDPVVNLSTGRNAQFDYPRVLIEIEFMRHEVAMDRLGSSWTSNLQRFGRAVVSTVERYFISRITQ